MDEVLTIDSTDAQYPRDFRQALVYDVHPAFDKSSATYRFDRVPRLDAQATRADVDQAYQQHSSIVFVTGSGHGSQQEFIGDNRTVIWSDATLPALHAKGKIVHLLTCMGGARLGLEFVAQGARGFWGYANEFLYDVDPTNPQPISSDQIAEDYFKLDATIDTELLNGSTPDAVYAAAETYFWTTWGKLQNAGGHPGGAWLLHDWIYLVGPGRSWGDDNATL